jgi:gas vesicle protein
MYPLYTNHQIIIIMTTIRKMLIGFTAGAILGILYAPQKGAKTRRKLSRLGNDMKEGWNSITDKITDSIECAREGVENLADNAIDKVESTQFDTEPTMAKRY